MGKIRNTIEVHYSFNPDHPIKHRKESGCACEGEVVERA